MLLIAMISAALAFDHSAFDQVLRQHVNRRGDVNYAAIQSSGALDGYLSSLSTASEPTARAEKMAFWINAYNALTVDLIADNYPLGSIRDLDGGDPWNARTFPVAGRQITLNDIEHKILRPMGDARIHAAVNCASRGCPPLAMHAFTAAGLNGQLDRASAHWATRNGVRIDEAQNTVTLNQIFDWYGEDFVGVYTGDIPNVDDKQEAAINFVAQYLPEQANYLKTGEYAVSYHSYSWKLNAQ
ncbi:MAG: DUF547 domain-containing protein [Myxococcota bacterium]